LRIESRNYRERSEAGQSNRLEFHWFDAVLEERSFEASRAVYSGRNTLIDVAMKKCYVDHWKPGYARFVNAGVLQLDVCL
jgi:hypothetical protein